MEEFSVSSVFNLIHCDFFATFVAIKQMLHLIPGVSFKSNDFFSIPKQKKMFISTHGKT